MSFCETCGVKVNAGRFVHRGRVGGLVVIDARGNERAWCGEHARHRPPWYGKTGWPWMREFDRLWAHAERRELLERIEASRDVNFDTPPPFTEGEVIELGPHSRAIVERIVRPRPDRWVLRRRLEIDERDRYLRSGALPYTACKPHERPRDPTPTEQRRASEESAYQSASDTLEAGAVLEGPWTERFARDAKVKRRAAIREAIERR